MNYLINSLILSNKLNKKDVLKVKGLLKIVMMNYQKLY